ncbi:MAG: phosphate-starvation-inducible PsiE family protein, partial [Chloroflexi bacterium]|nr:phosphate-starvation-inducible PsiE family protein [Chloroflexota bacterium]
VILLGTSVMAVWDSVTHGSVRDSAIDILDSVLLVMMTMEIVYTVTVSLEGHTLSAEPFLIIGAIAAIRRMLVITAESTKHFENIELFRSTLFELGLLAFIVIAIAAAMYMLRRSQRFVPETTQDHLNEHHGTR